jgi:hypothetical protein
LHSRSSAHSLGIANFMLKPFGLFARPALTRTRVYRVVLAAWGGVASSGERPRLPSQSSVARDCLGLPLDEYDFPEGAEDRRQRRLALQKGDDFDVMVAGFQF